MYDQAQVVTPDHRRYGPLEKRSDDQLRFEQLDRFDRRRVVDIKFHRNIVALLAQLDEQALGQTVEAVAEKQNAHG